MALNARSKKKTNEFQLFDVLYDDESRSSNRKVPTNLLNGEDSDRAVAAYIESQDRKIAEASGVLRGNIKKITRVDK